MIAIIAPLLTAAAIAAYGSTASHVGEALAPSVTAYASYDSSRIAGGWDMSYGSLLPSKSKLPVGVKDCETMRQWLLASGGADTSASYVRLHLVGTNHSTVTISGLHAQIIARIPMKPVTSVGCPSAGASATPNVALDLRKDTPNAMELASPNGDDFSDSDPSKIRQRMGAPYFAAHTITLSRGEPFDITVTGFVTGKSAVRWRLMVDVELDGQQQSVAVAGPTFITAPNWCEQAYQESWAWRWDLSPQRLVRQNPKDYSICPSDELPY